MAITSAVRLTPTHENNVAGAFLDDGTVKKSAFNIGFRPRYIKLVNATDCITYEWHDGMASGTTLKTVAAGTRTLDTADAAIAVGAQDTAIDLGAVGTWTVYDQTTVALGANTSRLNKASEKVFGFTVPAAVVITAKQFYFEAHD